METFEFQLDSNLFLEAEYTIDGYDEGTDYAPPSYATISLMRVWIVNGNNRIDITEMDPTFFDIQWGKLEEHIENELYNAQ